MMMLVQIAVGAMVLYGALLIYDGLLLAYRTGFGRANLLIMLAGVLAIAFFCVMGALAAGIGNPLIAFIVIGASFSALVFLAGFIGYAVATAVLIHRVLPSDYRYVIVLGAGLIEGVRPSRLLAGRLDVGKRCLDAPSSSAEVAATRRIIVCGGQGSDEKVAEARAMHDYLVARGVRDEAIIMEDESRTTWENLGFARRIMDSRGMGVALPGASRCVIVTNNFHALRTSIMARRLELDVAGIVGKHTRLYYLPGAAVRDYLGVLRLYKVPVALCLSACAVCAGFASFVFA